SEGALPVVFTPAGLSAVLLPVTQGLSGKAVLQGISPLATRVGEQVFDQRLSLTDDPLVPGRTASRPLDDECVPSRATCLVERGEIAGRVKDAAVAGNVYELLKRIAGLGNDARWAGARFTPSLLLEGVSVARR